MRLPIGTEQIISHGALDLSESKKRFRIVRIIFVPESPEVFEDCISLAVEEGVLQAVCLVARKTVRNIHVMARFHPLILADHGNERIRLPFPRPPIVPADVGPRQRRVTRLKLRFERQRMPDRVRRLAKSRRNAFEGIEVDAIGVDVLEELRHGGGCGRAFVARSSIPNKKWEEYLHAVTMKLFDH